MTLTKKAITLQVYPLIRLQIWQQILLIIGRWRLQILTVAIQNLFHGVSQYNNPKQFAEERQRDNQQFLLKSLTILSIPEMMNLQIKNMKRGNLQE